MARILSKFHHTILFVEGGAFADAESFHDEMAFKLGLPSWYGRNWDALLESLASFGDPRGSLCSHWEWRIGSRLVLLVRGLSIEKADAGLMSAFLQTVADANERLAVDGVDTRIWIEFNSTGCDRK